MIQSVVCEMWGQNGTLYVKENCAGRNRAKEIWFWVAESEVITDARKDDDLYKWARKDIRKLGKGHIAHLRWNER